jgi:hypothetical protein
MSGNSTRMGVAIAQAHWQTAAEALGLIALFVTGAAAGSLIVLGHGAHRQPFVVLAEALLLAAAALAYTFGQPSLAVAAIVLAMGLENAVFQIHGGAGLGLTYVTGALVKVGQFDGEGGDRWHALGLGARSHVVGGTGCGGRCSAPWPISGSTLRRSGLLPLRR